MVSFDVVVVAAVKYERTAVWPALVVSEVVGVVGFGVKIVGRVVGEGEDAAVVERGQGQP